MVPGMKVLMAAYHRHSKTGEFEATQIDMRPQVGEKRGSLFGEGLR